MHIRASAHVLPSAWYPWRVTWAGHRALSDPLTWRNLAFAMRDLAHGLLEDRKRVATEFRTLRKSKDLTQSELGKLLGYTPSYISKIESGQVPPPEGFAEKLMDALRMNADERAAFRAQISPPVRTLAPDLIFLGDALQTAFNLIFAAFGPRIRRQLTVDPLAKQAIAHVTCRLLDDWRLSRGFESPVPLVLDSGTTISYLAYAAMNTWGEPSWRCYTGNLLAALYLAQTQPVSIIGGGLDREFGTTLSDYTVQSLPGLLEHLRKDRKPTDPEPTGVMSVLAFDAEKGPYARIQDPANGLMVDVTGGSRSSRPSTHMKWKAMMLMEITNLVILVNPDKFERPTRKEWDKIAGEVVWKEAGGKGRRLPWRERLDDESRRTHVVTAIPERAETLPRVRDAVKRLLDQGFVLTETLFGHAEGPSSSRSFLTVVDLHSRPPYALLTPDELEAT